MPGYISASSCFLFSFVIVRQIAEVISCAASSVWARFFPSYTASFVCCLVWSEQMLPHMFLFLSLLAAMLIVHTLFPRSSSSCWDRDSLLSRNEKKKHFVTVKINIQKCIFVVNALQLRYFALQSHQWCRYRESTKACMWARRMWSSSAAPDPIHRPASSRGSGQCPQTSPNQQSQRG